MTLVDLGGIDLLFNFHSAFQFIFPSLSPGKGYVYVYRDNEGPSRSVCAMVFNATGVYSQTGEAYKWGVGVGFAAATTADHSEFFYREEERGGREEEK